MKKIIFLSAFFVTAMFSFAQAQQVAKVNSLEMYEKQKFNDVFTFELTTKETKERVSETSKFYKEYFTTTFDEKTNSIVVKMANQDPTNRKIMRRLFAGLGINEVTVEGKNIPVEEFFRMYVYTVDKQPTK